LIVHQKLLNWNHYKIHNILMVIDGLANNKEIVRNFNHYQSINRRTYLQYIFFYLFYFFIFIWKFIIKIIKITIIKESLPYIKIQQELRAYMMHVASADPFELRFVPFWFSGIVIVYSSDFRICVSKKSIFAWSP
jgi:hypothetical protein